MGPQKGTLLEYIKEPKKLGFQVCNITTLSKILHDSTVIRNIRWLRNTVFLTFEFDYDWLYLPEQALII